MNRPITKWKFPKFVSKSLMSSNSWSNIYFVKSSIVTALKIPANREMQKVGNEGMLLDKSFETEIPSLTANGDFFFLLTDSTQLA